MKTLSELRTSFVAAREIAKEASPSRAKEAAALIGEISQHCKELYEIAETYMERARCRNLYESIDNVIELLNRSGFCNETVAAFFGLSKGKGASFSEISSGAATILREEPPASVEDPAAMMDAPAEPVFPRGKAPSASKKLSTPPPASAKPFVSPPPAAPAASDFPPAPKPANGGNTRPTPAASNAPTGTIPKQTEDDMAPKSLDEFIGQAHIIRRLKEELEAAKSLGIRHLDHILLFGTYGLGKSTLMRLIGEALGVEYIFMDCTSMKNDVKSRHSFENFMIKASERNAPVVIGMDEIHKLPEDIQSNLLTLLESRIYNYVDQDGNSKNLYFPEMTFIGATTDYNRVLGTIKDRCSNLMFFMTDYTREEMTRILVNKLAVMGMTAVPEVLTMCVNRSRSSVRDIVAYVKGLRTKAVIRKTTVVTLEMAEEYFRERGLDEIGMNETERKILDIVANDPRGSISADAIAARLHMDPRTMAEAHEPFLMKLGFLTVTSRGRGITAKAQDYLKYGYFQYDDGFTIGSKPQLGGDGTPAPAEPAPVEPAPEEPAPEEPAPEDPTPAEPAPVDPTPEEPAPVEPTPAEPASVEPTPVEPTPVEPAPVLPVDPILPVDAEEAPSTALPYPNVL
ncbi:MAG: AAA family ATPase [Ruminococcaceae bacterium]|nr:AAA family ATPase [Oscillospiraceae bacterium]